MKIFIFSLLFFCVCTMSAKNYYDGELSKYLSIMFLGPKISTSPFWFKNENYTIQLPCTVNGQNTTQTAHLNFFPYNFMPTYGMSLVDYGEAHAYLESSVLFSFGQNKFQTLTAGVGLGARGTISDSKFNWRIGLSYNNSTLRVQTLCMDNTNKTIIADNTSFNPTFAFTEKSKHSSWIEDANAQKLFLFYRDEINYLTPSLGLEYDDPDKDLIFILKVGYNIALSTNQRLTLTQYGRRS